MTNILLKQDIHEHNVSISDTAGVKWSNERAAALCNGREGSLSSWKQEIREIVIDVKSNWLIG